MLDDLLALFGIRPDYDLDIMRPDQTLTEITTRVLEGMERVLAQAQARRGPRARRYDDQHRRRARGVLREDSGGHVEAGLRTRRSVGAVSRRDEPPADRADRFVPLRADGAGARKPACAKTSRPTRVFVTGNTVIDAFLGTASRDVRTAAAGVGRNSTPTRP